tara:strand:+ start:103 stop:297 length:195 start_codon:yes stop_codon:yes gene_type:complete
MVTLEKTLQLTHDWAIDRMHQLCENGYESVQDAYAVQCEFSEWLNPEVEEHDIFSLEYLGEAYD